MSFIRLILFLWAKMIFRVCGEECKGNTTPHMIYLLNYSLFKIDLCLTNPGFRQIKIIMILISKTNTFLPFIFLINDHFLFGYSKIDKNQTFGPFSMVELQTKEIWYFSYITCAGILPRWKQLNFLFYRQSVELLRVSQQINI